MNRNTLIISSLCLVALSAIVAVNLQDLSTLGPTKKQEIEPIELPLDDSNLLVIGNTHYLFDVVDNGPEELGKLLQRAEELAQSDKVISEQLSIAMVIHGPDLEIFQNQNYDKYKSLVDTAARLDAFGVIDFKLCQKLAFNGGFDIQDFPPFMEFVPFGPDEITRLKARGYVEF